MLVSLAAPCAAATTLPSDFVEIRVASGLTAPTAMAFAPDGRLFVCEQAGALRVIKDGALLQSPFVQIGVDPDGERGLLGVAVDPDFVANQRVYVYYTATAPTTHNRISRFTADGDVALPGSEVVILDLDDLHAAYHNGGAIHFGLDGKLYVGVGDNTAGSNSQTLDKLLGKMLRLNKDGTFPADNPFYSQAQGRNRAIWAMGLRNPFTFDIQPGTGRMFINDVGSVSWEEIDDGIAGSNYGWPNAEGPEDCDTYRCPVYAYNHSGACAITGGAFYNPQTAQFPQSYIGKYFFSDLCGGWIKVFDPAAHTVADFASHINGPVDLKVGPDGRLYYLANGSGVVAKIAAVEGASQPSIVRVDHVTGNSAVLHGSPSDTRRASQWQVDVLGGDFSSPVVDSGETTSALSSYKAKSLAPTTEYKARVRYRNDDDSWTLWSDPELDVNSRFTTLVATAIPPTVVDAAPANRSQEIAVTVSPVLTFNVAIAAASVTETSVMLVRKSAPVTAVEAARTLDAGGQALTIAPASLLDPDTTYRIRVAGGRSGIASRDGGIPGRRYAASFRTETALASSSPSDGAEDVAVGVAPRLDLKWDVDPATATADTVTLVDATSGRRVALASATASGATVTVTPAAPLKANHKHVLTIASGPAGLRFADGRQIGSKIRVTFKTAP